MACLNSKAQKEKGIASQSASEERTTSGGEGGELNKVLYGEVPPLRSNPLPFLCHFDRNGNHFVYLTLTNYTPLTYLV